MLMVVVAVGKTSGQDQTILGGLTSDWKREDGKGWIFAAVRIG
jgi:hypothetical protein